MTQVWNIQAGPQSERGREWGPLQDDHHLHDEFKEKVQANEDDEAQRGDRGEFEDDDSACGPEEYDVYERETSREGDEFFLNCGICDREIEFGWSEPDRRGSILPIEFSDFIPQQSWSDPKNMDAWQQRRWLLAGNVGP